MEPKIYNLTTADGELDLPVTDGVFVTDRMNDAAQTAVFVLAFYDANGDLVTPTAGTITPEAAVFDGQWLTPSSGDASIDATEVVAGSAPYTVPAFLGLVRYGRITLSGVAGAETCRAFFWRA